MTEKTAKIKDIDDVIEEFIEVLDFEAIVRWAKILDVEVNYPMASDLWPDWQAELTTEVGDAMREV